MNDDDIEKSIMVYVNKQLSFGDFPNRAEAIRYVTGEFDVMPSVVAKVLGRLIEEKKLYQRVDGQLRTKL